MKIRFWRFTFFFQLLTILGWTQQNTSVTELYGAYQKASTDGQRLEFLKQLFAYYRPINLDSAQIIVNQALPMAHRSKDYKAEVFFLTKQGTLYRMNKANPRTGLSTYLKALKLAESYQDSTAYGEIYYGIGRIQDDQSNREEAQKAFLNAIRWAKTDVIRYNAMESLAVHYANHNDLKQAEKYFKEAEKLVNLSPDLDNCQLRLKSNMGEFYLKYKRDTTQSLYYYRQSTRYAITNPQTDFERHLIECDALAAVFLTLKDYKNCIALCRKITNYKSNSKYNIQKTVSQSYWYMFKAFKDLGDYKNAALYADSAKVLTDNLTRLVNSDNIKKETYKLEATFNLERKQKEVELLAQKQKLQTIWTIAAVVIVLLLSAFSWILYRNRQSLAKKKSELTHLNATKDKLFAILSHDLRSPVGNLENNVMLTNWGALSREEFIQSTQSLGQEIGQVRTMLDNVLHWAISQMGGMKPTLTTTLILPTVETQTKLLLPNAQAKGVKITNAVEAQAQFSVDANHLAIIVRNLLQNAIKFTQAGGEIHLKSFEKGEISYLEIKDSGVGISQDRLGKLFEINKESSQQGTGQEQGTGLGLVLVKELVDANQGTIEVTSEIDKGTTFLIGFKQKTGLPQ